MSIPLQPSVVYGPIASRRLGTSLGINLLPLDRKFCLSDCIYCQYGRTEREAMKGAKLATGHELISEMERSFNDFAVQGLKIDMITFSGNGEPTLHPDFASIVEETRKLRDRYFPQAKTGILSDSSRVSVPWVREALMRLDERFMKLDAGEPETYRALNPSFKEKNWAGLVQGLQQFRGDLTIQTLFLSQPVANAEGTAFEAWVKTLQEIAPKQVHVYTVDRPPPESSVRGVRLERLEQIATQIEKELKISALFFGSKD